VATAVASVVTFLLGLLLGHRLALGRDKRQEFNAAALPVRGWLLQQEGTPNPCSHAPSQLEIDTFESCLGARDRGLFRAALADYRAKTSTGGSNAYGEMIYEDPDAILQAVSRLLPFTARR
jgi:hypothetical protein